MTYFDVSKQILIFIIIINIIGCGTSKLSEKEAISLAEKYVLENGYADEEVPTNSNKVKTWKNVLEPKAVFYTKGLRQWNVGFRIKKDSTRFIILRVFRNGKKIRMEHQNLQKTQEN